MLLPAEIESKTLIPALRAILAKKLAEDHNIREDQISKMLGVTQAAISNYIRGTRGDPSLIAKLLAEKQVAIMINELCDGLSLVSKDSDQIKNDDWAVTSFDLPALEIKTEETLINFLEVMRTVIDCDNV